ncbi:MAG: LPS export ABC transporter periplasmic protein LptC [Deltaproteobacteria bacterium]|nr:LPS export ABC transporter periplasmic protein LptC [Deltaproteobacteria bacterium]
MNRKIRISLLAFIALSIIGLTALVFVHYETKDSYKVTFNQDRKFEVKIEKIHYSGTNSEGRIEWELVADSAKRTKDVDLTILSNVTLVFFSKQGEPYTLKAAEGRFKEGTGEVTVTGNVVVNSEEGYRVATESLNYSMKTKVITTDAEVELSSKGMNIKGVGLLAEVDKQSFQLLKNVRAVFSDTSVKGAS